MIQWRKVWNNRLGKIICEGYIIGTSNTLRLKAVTKRKQIMEKYINISKHLAVMLKNLLPLNERKNKATLNLSGIYGFMSQ